MDPPVQPLRRLEFARCDSNPALRWQVECHPLREPPAVWAATRARIATEGFGARRGAADLLAENSHWEHQNLPYWSGEVDCCVNARRSRTVCGWAPT